VRMRTLRLTSQHSATSKLSARAAGTSGFWGMSCHACRLKTLIDGHFLRLDSAVFQRPESKLLSHFGLVPEGHTLDVANAVLGTLYYIILLLAPPLLRHLSPSAADDFSTFLRLMTTAAFTTTVYLLYALTFVIYDLCVLCMTCHIINATLMYRIVWRGDRLSTSKTTTAAKAD
jgi:Vitamin K epoxide reductase family